MTKTHLILDTSNILYRSFFAKLQEDEDISLGLALHSAFFSINRYYRKYKAHDIVLAFDYPNSWRKIYTKQSPDCVTHKIYKGTRRQKMTEKDKAKMAEFDTHIQEFCDLLKTKSGVIVLQEKYLEADDLIAGYIQKFPEDKHILISADKDFMQLLNKGDVTLVEPNEDKERNLDEWEGNPDLFIFEKCIRGDAGDNVQSSYPRLRKTKIVQAFTDPVARVNIMNNEFDVEELGPDGQLVTHHYKTQELFEENELLMDLTKQPDYIRELIFKSIDKSINNRGKFDYFHFLKFLGKHELNNIINDYEQFVPLLSGKGVYHKNTESLQTA
jgi:5'-3' exonuclease